ncbi:MAG: hypothetical protein ACFFDH_07020 [Promethearchaeota archaeon]
MTNIIEEAEIINKFLCQIKKSLPLGIRLRKNELNDILDEIEEHIWEKAIENAGDREPNGIDVQIAISQMGKPQDIANKFTNRSTPYVYISEELYPYYRKYRKALYWASILTLFIGIFNNYIALTLPNYSYYINSVLNSNLLTILVIYLTFFASLAILFCYLSNTGYLPYKLRKIKIQQQYSDIASRKKPKIQSFEKKILFLEIIPFLFIAIFIDFGPFSLYNLIFFLFLIIRGLRWLTKKKYVALQKLLILVDIFIMARLILEIFIIYLNSKNASYYWNINLSEEISLISSIFILLFLLYLWYEAYLFFTLKEKRELYLKELSLIKRINKKEIILGSRKNDDDKEKQKASGINKTLTKKKSNYNFEFEKAINAYLKTAKRKLPIWLKRMEKYEIIKILEEEIRETILEFEVSPENSQKTLVQKLDNLVPFKILLSDYKQQGKPKIYISKELWVWYSSTIKSILTYTLIIFLFTIVLELASNASFSVFEYILIYWFINILLFVIVTGFFVFLSLNDIIPEDIKMRKFLYHIWELSFVGLFIGFGIRLIFSFIFTEYFLTSFGISTINLVSVLLLLLGGIKTLKVIFKSNRIKFKSFLIILSLSCCLVINFIVSYTFYSNDFITYINTFPIFSDLIILLINIEIIYEIFHLFFKTKKFSD